MDGSVPLLMRTAFEKADVPGACSCPTILLIIHVHFPFLSSVISGFYFSEFSSLIILSKIFHERD